MRNFNYRCSREEIYFASTYSNSLSSDCYINATDYLYRTNTYYLLNWWICYRVRQAAGGVLQLAVSTANEFFPTNKGKITSIVMISSSLANYIVLNVASYITKAGGIEGPKYVLLFNVAITVIGILLAIFVNMRYKNESKIATK